MNEKKRGGGRPRFEINEKTLEQAETLAAQGLTKEQIAASLGICYDTLNEKSKAYPEFSEAIKKGQAKGIEQVSNVVFNKAISGELVAALFYLKCRGGWSETNNVNLNADVNANLTVDDTKSRLAEKLSRFANSKSNS